MAKISNKTTGQHTKAALAARITSRNIQKKRAYSKLYKKTWLALKLRLSKTQTMMDAAILANDDDLAKKYITIQDGVLSEMRTFSDYKFTNTGKKYK